MYRVALLIAKLAAASILKRVFTQHDLVNLYKNFEFVVIVKTKVKKVRYIYEKRKPKIVNDFGV